MVDSFDLLRLPVKISKLWRVPLYTNALYLMLANVISAVFGFAFWILAARFYTTTDVGLASAVLSAASLIIMLSGLGLGYGLIRFLPAHQQPGKLINSTFVLTGLLGIAVAAFFVSGLKWWSPKLMFLQSDPSYLVIFLVFMPIGVWAGLTDQVNIASRRAGFVLIRSLVYDVLRLILPVILAAFMTSLGIFVSWGAAMAVSLAVSLCWLIPKAQPGYHFTITVNRKLIGEIMHFSFFNYVANFCWALPGFVLPLLVINQLGAANNAYFFMGWAMSGVLTMIPGAIANSLLAEGSHAEAELLPNVRRSFKMVFLILIPAVVLLGILADKFLLLYGEPYAQNAAILLRWLAVAALPLSVNTIFLSVKRVQKKAKPVIFLTAFAGILTLVGAYFLLPGLGINGAGIAWLTAQSLTALVTGCYLLREMRRNRERIR